MHLLAGPATICSADSQRITGKCQLLPFSLFLLLHFYYPKRLTEKLVNQVVARNDD